MVVGTSSKDTRLLQNNPSVLMVYTQLEEERLSNFPTYIHT